MFDFAWSEIVLIGAVALIAIGPKDLPVAIKAVAEMVKKARRMAGEFQTHVDEMVRDADLQGVKSTFDDLRRMDIKGKILSAVDGDGGLRKTLNENPFDLNPAPPPVPVHDTLAPGMPAVFTDAAAADAAHIAAVEAEPETPRLPPSFIPPTIAASGVPGPPAPPPAFVPPSAAAMAMQARRAAIPFT